MVKNFFLFEDEYRVDFLPFTFTRAICDIHLGMDSIRAKWSRALNQWTYVLGVGILGELIYSPIQKGETLWINARLIPDAGSGKQALSVGANEYYENEKGDILYARFDGGKIKNFKGIFDKEFLENSGLKRQLITDGPKRILRQLPDLYAWNAECLREDFDALTKNAEPSSATIDDRYSIIYGKDNVYIAPGVKMRACIINAEDGPVYIDEGAVLNEGSMIHGAHYIGENAVLNMGARLRGDSTIGGGCKVGGEIANSILHPNSNKAHDGFLGNSVIGSWCNLGADTNNSNLKNNYAEVKAWNYRKESFVKTGQIFCGLFMGDHSKCGINTMFNTGTVVGVSANIFGSGFPRNFIPSFSWGGAAGFTTFKIKDAFEVARAMMARRKLTLSENEMKILEAAFEYDAKFRVWENS